MTSPPTTSRCSWPRTRPQSTATTLSSRETAPPAFHILTNQWLFHHIVSYQWGIPVALYQFWTYHDPKPARGPVSFDSVPQLIQLVVESGRPYHLDLIRSSCFSPNELWRTPEFDSLARVAVEKERADLLEWMVENNMQLTKPLALWRTAIQKYAGDSSFKVLELLHKACPLEEYDAQKHLPRAISTPTAPLLRWISAHYPSVAFPLGLTKAASGEGDLEALRFLLEHPNSRGCHISAFRMAYKFHYLGVLEFLITKYADTMTDDFGEKLVLDNSICIQEIVSRYPAVFKSISRKMFIDAVRAGEDDKMQQLYANGNFDTSELISIDDAARWKGLKGIEFLHGRGMAQATTEAMDAAAEAMRWDIVEFLHINRTEGCTTRAADAAVKSGNINCVRFFLEKRHEGCSVAAMDHAAETGSIEILRYLHEHSKVGCTAQAMDLAATQGHLRVVKFLHENRSEGCTTSAIDGAAHGGFLDVVQYLCEHRPEGCTKGAVQGALENHHLGVVDLLYKHYTHLIGAELLSTLLLRGAFDVFMTLREKFPEEAGRIMEAVMFEAGKQFELRTIWFIVTELGRFDLRPFAIEGAGSLDGRRGRLWRDAVDVITTPTKSPVNTVSWGFSMRHPFLYDVRTPTWAVRAILMDRCVGGDELRRCGESFQWSVRAVSRRDMGLLQLIRELPPGTTELCLVNPFRHHFEPFSFKGARAEAIRIGDQHILEWLLANVDLPIEPTLLGEAVYYHRFEIAEWLLAHHPAACTELDWTSKANETEQQNYGLRDGLLDSLECHEAVWKALPFSGIIDFAARKNDVDSLTRLHELYPKLFTPRPSLVELANLEECRDAINFLLEIGWPADVCGGC